MDGASLPGWISFEGDGYDTYYTSSSSRIYINPTASEVNTYTITATYTPLYGTPLASFVVLTLTVECQVTGFTNPSNPSDIQYTIYDKEKEFDMNSLSFTQDPACGYPYTVEFLWSSGTNAYITQDTGVSGIIHIFSLLPDSA